MTHVFFWGPPKRKAGLKGRRCRVLARSRRMGSVLVEFEDGQREITSRRALRRLK